MEIIISIVSIAILVTVVSFSYAYIKKDEKEAGYNEIGTNCIKIKLEDYSPEIKLQNAYPVPDSIGKNTKPYQFTITNECDVPVTYQVNLEVYNDSTMNAKNNIAVLFDENEKKHVLGTNNDSATPIEAEDKNQIKESYKIGESSVRGHETNYHKIVLWLDESAGNETQEKTFKCRVAIEAKQDELAKYTEPLLNGADPVITGELIPVEINEEGKAIKADPSKKWYSYGEKEWANAVILNDSGKEKVYGYGEEIPESEIESYFVWIPKYRYQLFDEQLGKYTQLTMRDSSKQVEIQIEFGLDNTINSVDECETPMNEERTQGLSGENGSCKKGKWMTHPAFISFDVNGLWVGKFDIGNSLITDTNNETAHNNPNESTNLIIKPNQYIWRAVSVGNAYKIARAYKENLDSHMMKNTEWGAVAYLSHSKYGICENGVCQKIRINNNSNYVSGYAATNEAKDYSSYNEMVAITPGQDHSLAYNYTNKKSTIASTTGNYTGVYDMAGGASFYVMEIMLDANNKPILANSGITETELNAIDQKYYDVYKYNTNTQNFSNRILGDATGEMGPGELVSSRPLSSWHDALFSLNSATDALWIIRGGHSEGAECGPFFAGTYHTGNIAVWSSFGIVLAPR